MSQTRVRNHEKYLIVLSCAAKILGKKCYNFDPYSPISSQCVLLTLSLHICPRKLAFLLKKYVKIHFGPKKSCTIFRCTISCLIFYIVHESWNRARIFSWFRTLSQTKFSSFDYKIETNVFICFTSYTRRAVGRVHGGVPWFFGPDETLKLLP